MGWLLDLLYLAATLVTFPIWLTRLIRTGKFKTDWPARFGRTPPRSDDGRKCILLHAVSVGEINAIRLLVERLADGPQAPRLVIATTTDTGTARARDLVATQHEVVRFPFDLSFVVRRFLRSIRPDLVVLVELEVWPNFTAACARRGIPVCVVNGRLTERSHKAYRLLGPLIRPSFRRLAAVAVQNDRYAQRFEALGIPPDRIRVAGTMKWDTAEIDDRVDGAA